MFVSLVQIDSPLDSQSKFQMFTPLPGRHLDVAQSPTNMAAPYWAL